MLEKAAQLTADFISEMPKASRKQYGQFFTDMATARYMASLYSIPDNRSTVSILDAGAGTGMLSIALLQRINQDSPGIREIYLTCYESDAKVLPILQNNLEHAAKWTNIPLHFEIIADNYITSQQRSLFSQAKEYDLVIGNPPYKKISKDAPEAKAMPHVCHGAPNLYFLFAAMGVDNLRQGGQMVYIVPRSWTSGAYFSKFRKYFLSNVALEQVHLFCSRDKVFQKENVLQETIIIKASKGVDKPANILITSSDTSLDLAQVTRYPAPYDTVVHGEEKYVYLVTNQEDADTILKLRQWKDKLPSLGLKMKTGLTVDFREKQFLRDAPERGAVPLFYPHHIRNGKVSFPAGKGNEYVASSEKRLCQRNSNYLFIKRFTSKEEPRRLQCAVYLARKYPDTPFISTQNKINFIDGLRELSECIVYGLYVLFNSSLYDRYYRILNGSTQVNSTEINNMPVPGMSIIESMGKDIIHMRDFSEHGCDEILANYVNS